MPKTSSPPPAVAAETTQTPSPTNPTASDDTKITAETSPQDAVRIAAQIRKEKKIREASRKIEDDRRKFSDEQRQYEPWKRAAELSKKSKLAALRELGITYEDITAEMLNEGTGQPAGTPQPNVEEIVAKQIAAFRKEQEEASTKLQQETYDNQIANIRGEAKRIAETSGNYPLVKASDAYQDISEYIENEFYRTKTIVSVEEALEKVEEQIAEGILHLAKIDKIKSQLLPQEQKIEPTAAQTQQKITTLTHKTAVSPPSDRPLTSAERRQRAINVASGLSPT